jgi:hypothetical protein
VISCSTITTIPLNTWTHLAAVHKTTKEVDLFVNGVKESFSHTDNYANFDPSVLLTIGKLLSLGNNVNPLHGYIDSFRITEGVVRYTSNFNPETDTYLAPTNTSILQSYSLTANTTQETNLLAFNEDPSDSYLKARITNTSASPATITLNTEIIPVFSPTGMTWRLATVSQNAQPETGYILDNSNNINITLPLNPSIGSEVAIILVNSSGSATINGNGNNINSSPSNYSISQTEYIFRFIYSNPTVGWSVFDSESNLVNNSRTYNKSQNVATSVLTDGTNINIDASLSNVFRVVLGGNRVLENPTNLVDGQRIMIIVVQDAIGSRTLTFGNNYKFPSGSTNVLSTMANAIDIFDCVSNGTDMYCTLLKNYI